MKICCECTCNCYEDVCQCPLVDAEVKECRNKDGYDVVYCLECGGPTTIVCIHEGGVDNWIARTNKLLSGQSDTEAS